MEIFVLALHLANIFSVIQGLNQPTCWNSYSSQMFGGISQSSAATENDCESLCLTTPGCNAFEFVPSNPNAKCFTFTSTNAPTIPASGVTHFVLKCTCSWTPYISSQSYGGVLQNGIISLTQCRNTCVFQWLLGCHAVEWTADNRCFFFTSIEKPIYSSVPGVDHYIWSCLTSSAIATVPPSIPQPSPIPSCFWQTSLNSNTIGGSVYPAALNIDSCKQACINNFNCMYGFDWNPLLSDGQKCWLSSNNNIVSNNGLTHYAYNCSASNTAYWTITYGVNSPMGVLQPTVYTIDDCKKACTSLSSCYYGFDWDKVAAIGQQCWLSINATLTTYSRTDHYSLTQGSATAPPQDTSACTWFSFVNSNSPGGTVQPLYTNLADCQKYCRLLTRAVCTGIDWDSNAFFKCWFSTNNYTNINGFPGVTHYNYSCPGDAPAGAVTQPASTQLGWNCGYVPYYNSTGKPGEGQLKSNYNSDPTLCRNQCTVQITCKAYEWRTDSVDKCWFYTTSNPPYYQGTVAYRTYYVYVAC